MDKEEFERILQQIKLLNKEWARIDALSNADYKARGVKEDITEWDSDKKEMVKIGEKDKEDDSQVEYVYVYYQAQDEIKYLEITLDEQFNLDETDFQMKSITYLEQGISFINCDPHLVYLPYSRILFVSTDTGLEI